MFIVAVLASTLRAILFIGLGEGEFKISSAKAAGRFAVVLQRFAELGMRPAWAKPEQQQPDHFLKRKAVAGVGLGGQGIKSMPR